MKVKTDDFTMQEIMLFSFASVVCGQYFQWSDPALGMIGIFHFYWAHYLIEFLFRFLIFFSTNKL